MSVCKSFIQNYGIVLDADGVISQFHCRALRDNPKSILYRNLIALRMEFSQNPGNHLPVRGAHVKIEINFSVWGQTRKLVHLP